MDKVYKFPAQLNSKGKQSVSNFARTAKFVFIRHIMEYYK